MKALKTMRIFADGDTERCWSCGEDLWFEVRNEKVLPRQVRQVIKGSSLGSLLKKTLN